MMRSKIVMWTRLELLVVPAVPERGAGGTQRYRSRQGVEHEEDAVDPPLPGEDGWVVPEVVQQVGRLLPDEDVWVDAVEEQVVVSNIWRKWWGTG